MDQRKSRPEETFGQMKVNSKINLANIEMLLQGSINMHVHYDPNPNWERCQDASEVVSLAQEYGMRLIVLKQSKHCYLNSLPCAPYAAESLEVSVFSSLTLDLETGGLNLGAVEAAADLEAKVIWIPVIAARNSRRLIKRLLGMTMKGEGFRRKRPSGWVL